MPPVALPMLTAPLPMPPPTPLPVPNAGLLTPLALALPLIPVPSVGGRMVKVRRRRPRATSAGWCGARKARSRADHSSSVGAAEPCARTRKAMCSTCTASADDEDEESAPKKSDERK